MPQHDDYLAVVAGENRFGWRMAIPIAFLEKYGCDPNFTWLGADVIHGRDNDLPSILIALLDCARDCLIICHYSLISPNISSTIAHIPFDRDNWCFKSVCLMGVEYLTVVFYSWYDYGRYRFEVINITTSSQVRTFDIVIPNGYNSIIFRIVEGDPPILKAYLIWSPSIHEMIEFEIPTQDNGPFIPVVPPKSSKSVPLCEKTWTVFLMDVFRSLKLLNPIPYERSINRSISHSRFALCQRMDSRSGIIVYHSHHGILHRWSKVPSLKFMAAESLFRARPTLDRWQLEKMVGFDIFHGIPTKRDEDIETVDVEETVVVDQEPIEDTSDQLVADQESIEKIVATDQDQALVGETSDQVVAVQESIEGTSDQVVVDQAFIDETSEEASQVAANQKKPCCRCLIL